MKKVFHKITAICMAFVVLFSTMSFTVHMHYCGELLIDAAVFQEVKDCGMQMSKKTSTTTSFQKETCCSNKAIAIEGQDTLKNTSKNFTLKQQFVATFLYTYKNLFKETVKIDSFKDDDPPPVARKIYKLHELYLI